MTQTAITTEKAIGIAAINAKEASETKDWRLRDKRSKAFKALATEFVKSGKCHIIATPHELKAQYPSLFSYDGPADDKKYIWAISPTYNRDSYVKFSFVAIKSL